MQKLHRVLMPKKVFFELERLLLMKLSKGLVMVVISKSTRITGCAGAALHYSQGFK